MNYVIVVLLVTLSGIFSGLTIGLFSLDLSGVERQMELGNLHAKRVYPIRKKGNLLLCTLLLGNVAVNSALSIFLGTIASGVFAGLIATSLIVIFGEILPAAVFTKYALWVGAKSVPLVRVFLFALYPISYPLAASLDKFLGGELPTIWGKDELSLILEEHRKAKDSDVDEDDARIAIGALHYSEKTVAETMTPLDNVFSVREDTVVDAEAITAILDSSYARIPVLSANGYAVAGILEIRDLISYNVGEGKTFEQMSLIKDAPILHPDVQLDRSLDKLIATKSTMGLVKEKEKLMGVLTTEDILEVIIQKDINA